MICKECNSVIPDDSEFCQCCGAMIEGKNRGKALFRNKRNILYLSLLGGFAFLGICFGVVMLCMFVNANKSIVELNSTIIDLQAQDKINKDIINQDSKKYRELEAEKNALEEEYASLKDYYADLYLDYYDCYEKAAFLDQHIAFVGADGNKYHKYGCPYLDLSSFWAYNTEAAKDLYKACPYCN